MAISTTKRVLIFAVIYLFGCVSLGVLVMYLTKSEMMMFLSLVLYAVFGTYYLMKFCFGKQIFYR